MRTVRIRRKPIVPAQVALILAIAAAGTRSAVATPVSATSAISQPGGAAISWGSNVARPLPGPMRPATAAHCA